MSRSGISAVAELLVLKLKRLLAYFDAYKSIKTKIKKRQYHLYNTFRVSKTTKQTTPKTVYCCFFVWREMGLSGKMNGKSQKTFVNHLKMRVFRALKFIILF